MSDAKDIIEGFKEFKSIPHISLKLTRLLSGNACTIKELEEIISYDPTLVMRLLRIVNSAYYGLTNRVESISDAVIFLGLETLRNVVVTDALKNIFVNSEDNSYFSPERLFLHSSVVAICSQMICERIHGKKGDIAFLCGIIHDAGMILEYQTKEEEFLDTCKVYQEEQKNFQRLEQKALGTDHTEIGYLIAKEWQLPESVLEPIKNHHSFSDSVTPDSSTGILVLAEYMTARMSYIEMDNMEVELPSSLTQHVSDNIHEYKELAQALPESVLQAKELYQAG